MLEESTVIQLLRPADSEDIWQKVSFHNERHYPDFSQLVRSTFDGAAAHFADGSIDLLHLLNESMLFDAKWYWEKYPDVATAALGPAHHYLTLGAGEGRDPSPHFSTQFYYLANPVAQVGTHERGNRERIAA